MNRLFGICLLMVVLTIPACANEDGMSVSNPKAEGTDGEITPIDPKESAFEATEEYTTLLTYYVEALNKHPDDGYAEEHNLFPRVSDKNVSVNDVGYAFIDLNEDGINELLVLPPAKNDNIYGSEDNYLFALYTVKDHKLKVISTMSFGPRDDGYYLYDDGILKLKLGGTGIIKNRYYELNKNGELAFIDEIDQVIPYDEEKPKFYRCIDEKGTEDWPDEDNSMFKEISESQAEEIQNSYEKSLELKRFMMNEYCASQ